MTTLFIFKGEGVWGGVMPVYCFNIYNLLMNIYAVCFGARGGTQVIHLKSYLSQMIHFKPI